MFFSLENKAFVFFRKLIKKIDNFYAGKYTYPKYLQFQEIVLL